MACERRISLLPQPKFLDDTQATDCRFGICMQPSWAKHLASPKLFLLVFSFLTIIEGMLFMYFVAVMTTIEQYFQMKSEALASVLSFGELIPVLVGLVCSFFLGEGDRPRWMAFSTMLISIGSFVMSLPYFVWRVARPEDRFNTGNEESDNVEAKLCISNSWTADPLPSNESSTCTVMEAQEHNMAVIIVYIMGYMMFNTGAILMFIVGTPYLDDNVRQKNSPLYLAITCGIRTIGPMLGFVMAYVCLTVYVNPYEITPFDQSDRRWLGAWWLGYIILSIAMFFGALLIIQFPRRLPSRHWTPAVELTPQVSSTVKPNGHDQEQENESNLNLKDIIPVAKRVLTNFLLLSRIFSEVFTWAAVHGFCLYLPKYFEHQFHVSSSYASILSSVAIIAPMIVSDVVVGVYLQRVRPSSRRLAMLLIVTKLVSAIVMPILMSIKCESAYVIGLDESWKSQSCDAGCECSPLPFRPVCAEGQNYLSACHLGCSTVNITSTDVIYGDCICANGTNVINDLCTGVCSHLITYILLTALGHLMLGVEIVGGLIFMLRCVETKDKTVAMGIAALFFGIFTCFPTPLLFASVIDAACSLWSMSCGETGACLLYDMDNFRYYLHGIPFGLLLVGLFWDFLFFRKCGKITLFAEEES